MRPHCIVLCLAVIAMLEGVPASPAQDPAQSSKITKHTLRLEEDAQPGRAKVSDLAWLTGNWVGTGMGGHVEAVWTAPSGGSMVGAFKLLQDGEPFFYEFMVFLELEETVELRLKHFNPDGTGWEEKDDYLTFPLVRVEAGIAYFRGLTYKRTDDGGLVIYLAMKSQEGYREVEFTLRRL